MPEHLFPNSFLLAFNQSTPNHIAKGIFVLKFTTMQ